MNWTHLGSALIWLICVPIWGYLIWGARRELKRMREARRAYLKLLEATLGPNVARITIWDDGSGLASTVHVNNDADYPAVALALQATAREIIERTAP